LSRRGAIFPQTALVYIFRVDDTAGSPGTAALSLSGIRSWQHRPHTGCQGGAVTVRCSTAANLGGSGTVQALSELVGWSADPRLPGLFWTLKS
jgi:hypothetical protein